MKFIIVSNFFYPEITPRAFRTTELTKELCRQGHIVYLVIPNKKVYQENSISIPGLTILYGMSSQKTESQSTSSTSDNKFVNFIKSLPQPISETLKRISRYFFPDDIYKTYDHGITKSLMSIKVKPDVLISIAYPASIHLSVFIAHKTNKYLRHITKISEFSDPPFVGDNYFKVFPINLLYIYIFAYFFDYFTIPTEKAISRYKIFKRRQNIKVIPQGFPLNDVIMQEYKANDIPNFAYAGSFIKDLRNPEFFFKFLTKQKNAFVFHLYMINRDPYFLNMVKKYQLRMQGKIIMHQICPREKLIYELSAMDFLINFDNAITAMVPSKLIDFVLTSRPIISFNSKTFNSTDFVDFLSGDYQKRIYINIDNYDIKNIVTQFLQLVDRANAEN